MKLESGLSFLYLTIAQAVIGVNVVLGKSAIDIMPIYMYLACRFLVSSLGLTVFFCLLARRWTVATHPQQRVTKSDWILMILSGICAGLLFNYLFIWGLKYTTATSAGIIGSSLPAITAICAVFILKERLNSIQITAILLAMVGIIIIGLNNPANPTRSGVYGSLFGDFLILLAMFPEAWFSIISKHLAKRIHPLACALVANIITFFSFIPLAYLQRETFPLSQFTSFHYFIILLGGVCSLLFYWLWPLGLRSTTASQAALFGGVMPISTCLFAIFFLGEAFHILEGVGMLLIFLSIAIGTGSLGENFLKLKRKEVSQEM